MRLSFKLLTVYFRTAGINIQKFYTVQALRSVFCADLRTNSDLCHLRH